MWGRKCRKYHGDEPLDDITQAQDMQNSAREEMWELLTQQLEVRTLAKRLARRRERNHFGEELTVSFHPKARV
jgi:2-iminoacetate synthase ThiH